MLRLTARLPRRALSSLECHYGSYRSSLLTHSVQRAAKIEHCILGDFLKLGSHGSHMFSSFASGFTPLKHKPLESLIDVERAKHQTPEDLASIWDDVSSCDPLIDSSI